MEGKVTINIGKLPKLVDETIVTISEIDRITGSSNRESTIGNLKSWELSEDQIDEILEGKTVKCISPNGRRNIWITKKI